MARFQKHFSMLVMIAISISTASAADNSMFNYQGRVLVQGVPYTGTGRMKAAIIATTSTSSVFSIWSNDGTSVAGSEPTNFFDVSVTAGVFDIMIGDTTVSGMAAIPAIMFNRDDELKVRVWFNDGVHGYQQLAPDRRLTHPRRLGISEVRSETRLYVNGTTGNDLNSGLTATTGPKKTIQAAVDMVPSRLFNNVIIDVADGIYRESVFVNDIHAQHGFKFTLLGDEATVPSDSASPAVRVTGTNNDTTHDIIRLRGVRFDNCTGCEIKGFLMDYFSIDGLVIDRGRVAVTNCKAADSSSCIGFDVYPHAMGNFSNCWANNLKTGFSVTNNASMDITNCGATNCNAYGAIGQADCTIELYGNNTFARNLFGLGLWQNSSLWCITGTHAFNKNTTGLLVNYASITRGIASVTYSGNGTNISVSSESHAY